MSEPAPLKAVVDTNLFVSGMISPRRRPSRLLDLWHAGGFELLLSDWQYTELQEFFSRPKIMRNYQITPRALADLFAGLALATRVETSVDVSITLRDA